MNAPTATALLAKPTITMIALGDLVPSNTHIQELRRARFDPKLIAELAESIKGVGVLQAILVRRSQANGRTDRFEIVAGERRFLAAKKAGVAEIPATVRDLSDDQVLEVQLIENLQREGLHELEEAEGYEELMKLKKISADAVADMVGRSRSYVFKRTKLLALCQDARKAFYAGELDASTALLIARIPGPEFQKQAMAGLKEQREYGDIQNFKDASAFIRDNFMLRLKQAPFDTNDKDLVPAAGSCQACPKRTGNSRDLFGDVKEGDLCTDAKCYDDKRQAHHAGARKALEAKGKKVIHGDAAKKILPNWDGNSSNNCSNGYIAFDEYSHDHGKRVKDLVPADYEPVLIQHPWTGKIFEAATKNAIAKAKGAKKQSDSGSYNYGAAMARAKAKGPDVDEMLTERLAKLIYEKAPKSFGKSWLHDLAKVVFEKLNLRDDEAVAKAFGWPASAFSKSGYGSKLPSQAEKLDERGLVLLMFQLVFATRWGRERVQKLFGIKEQEIRDQIIEERKAAAKKAREEKAAAKAKPKAAAKPKAKAKKKG